MKALYIDQVKIDHSSVIGGYEAFWKRNRIRTFYYFANATFIFWININVRKTFFLNNYLEYLEIVLYVLDNAISIYILCG